MTKTVIDIIFTIVIYFGLMLISILILTSEPKEFKHGSGLVNRKWKRILWTLSCLLFVPLIMVAMRGPRTLWREIEDFIVEGCGEDREGKI